MSIPGYMKYFIQVISIFFCCNTYSQTEIPLRINDGGYIFLTIRLGSVETDTANFLLDTGGGINVMSGNLADKFRSILKPAGSHTGTRHNGEKMTTPLHNVSTLSIGDFKKNNVVIGEYDGFNNQPFDGLLSMNYFENTPFTIDFVNQKLLIETDESIKRIQSKGEKIPIELKRNGKHELDFFVQVCIHDTITLKAEFDTGSGFYMFMLHPDYIARLNLKIPEKKPEGIPYYIYQATLPEVSICGVNMVSSKNAFAGFKEGLIYQGLIGSGMFRNHKLTINIPEKEMRVWQ